ncbi:MAG: glycosyltransferase family 2 protein [Vicinamibacterales bacterium]
MTAEHVPKVSIVFPVRNELANYRVCLESLYRQSFLDFEALWVEGGSSDDTTARVRREFPQVTVIDTGGDLGFRRKCRLGAASARGDYVLLVNADVEFEPDWLERLVRVLDTHPDVGVVAPLILLYDRRDLVNEAGNTFHFSGVYGSRGLDRPRDGYRGLLDIGIPSGCCFMIRRALWQQLGGFSEDFDAYDTGFHSAAEDQDLCWRVRLAGHRILLESDAVMYHKYVRKPFVAAKLNTTFFSLWLVLLRNFRWRTLLALSPFALLMFGLLFSAGVVHGSKSVAMLTRTQAWVIGHIGDIMRMRRRVQAHRAVSDLAIVRVMEHHLNVTSIVALQGAFSALCAAYYQLFRALVFVVRS